MDFLLSVRDENDIQNTLFNESETLLNIQSTQNEHNRLFKTLKKIKQIESQIKQIELKLEYCKDDLQIQRLHLDLDEKKQLILELKQDEMDILERLNGKSRDIQLEESEKDRLIRTGHINPFQNSNDYIPHNHTVVDTTRLVTLDEDDEYELMDDDDKDYINDMDDEELINESRYIDDGDTLSYEKRIKSWAIKRRKKRCRINKEEFNYDFDYMEEINEPSPYNDDADFNNGFKCPGDVYCKLFEYQRTCLSWLLELHRQETGGIIGDEMGLGKTIQIISFLAMLSFSNRLNY